MNLSSNCKVYLLKGNRFEGNSASDDGGAIIWTSNRFIDDSTNVFKNNDAFYGKNIANYPK